MGSRACCVVTFLLNVVLDQLPPPLLHFQNVVANKEGSWKIVREINKARGDGVPEGSLGEEFERRWPDLAGQLGQTLRTELHGDVLVITPSAEHFRDEQEIKTFQEKMKSLLNGENKRIVIDLTEGKGLVSAAFTDLFSGIPDTHRGGAEVVLVNIQPEARALFEATKMLLLVRSFPTLDEALAYFERKKALENV